MIAGEYTAPPAHGPMMTEICGITPESIGKNVSLGCIRLQNEAIESLYDYIPIGTKIVVTSSNKSFEAIAKEHDALK